MTSPKVKVKGGHVLEEAWDYFTFSLTQYKTVVNIAGNEKHMMATTLREVNSRLYNRLGNCHFKDLTEVLLLLLDEARKLVVKKRNKLVNRMKLASMV